MILTKLKILIAVLVFTTIYFAAWVGGLEVFVRSPLNALTFVTATMAAVVSTTYPYQ